MADEHLFVLLHGLWGNKTHLHKARELLLAEYPDVRVLAASAYEGNLTYDGISVCGQRVIAEIEERIKEIKDSDGVTIRKFSIAGYSLGGLVARYVVGEFHNSGFFNKVKPMNFTTFATPHLGVCSEKPGYIRSAFNYYGRNWLGQSGRDMFLGNEGILPKLADPEGYYYRALTKFERLSLYANITNDRSVHFFSAFISERDPFANLDSCEPQYVHDYEPIILDLSRAMKILHIPAKKKMSRRDYVFFTLFYTIGPVFLLMALISIAVSAQLSERRVRQLLQQSSRRAVELTQQSAKNESEAALMQEVVEDLLDATGSEEQETGPKYDGTQYQSSSSGSSVKNSGSDSSRRSSVSTLDTVCNSVVAHKARNPEFLGEYYLDKTLDLEEVQIRMCKDMNNLAWNKYAVQIHETFHSHAAIVNRRGALHEGDIVLRHWAKHLAV
ncbi:putative serine esterase-domain-containing protein [Lipomyces kononenkoae]|uniref:Serine esterase-domain-containing protein n=1 Tax=Lipomyces kononenkoae TaxID=34357 RepID=A0ACC3SZW7_LIPKO